MKLKYPCLVLDHDDTTVNSTATVHYPCFVEYMEKYFPHIHLSLEEYFLYNFDPGVIELFTGICGMTWDQMLDEERYWKEYVKHHIPQAYPGIRELMERQKAEGGLVCVVSHSFDFNIRRDYDENGLPEPDLVFGWEQPLSCAAARWSTPRLQDTARSLSRSTASRARSFNACTRAGAGT